MAVTEHGERAFELAQDYTDDLIAGGTGKLIDSVIELQDKARALLAKLNAEGEK